MGVSNFMKGMFGVGIASILGIGIYSFFGGETTKKKKDSKKSKTEEKKVVSESQEKSTKTAKLQESQIQWNVEMMNLRTTEDWKGIIESTKDKEDLLSKTFLAEAYFKLEDLEKTKEVLKSVIATTPKDDYDIFSIGKAHQLSDEREKAFECFEKAASKENPLALYTIGVYYQNGIFVKKDEQKGVKYFKMAADLNEPISCYLLALSMTATPEAEELFRKSSEKNYLPALMAMGDISIQKQKQTEASEYFKKCSDLNYCPGLRSYSYLLMNGFGVDVDEKLGVELLLKGIQLGDVESSVTLSTYYQAGKGVEKDEKKAFDICNEIPVKTPVVYYQLSLFYLNGVGVEASDDKHLELLQTAAQMGYPAALYLLANYMLGNPSSNDEISVAIDYLANAAKLGHAPAIKQLQQIYEQTFTGEEQQQQ
eukprot:gene4554-7938_t